MMQKSSARSHWLGAPLIDSERAEFERTVLRRFDMATDQALAYMERKAERQIAKARTLLPYNAILFALLSLSDARLAMPKLALLGGLLALLSCLFALAILHAPWGANDGYANAQAEFKQVCGDAYRRACLVRFAMACTALTTFIVAVPLLRQLGP